MLNSQRAPQLAAALPAAAIPLPPGVQAALKAYDAATAMTLPAAPRPGELAAAALAQAAATAVAAAAKTGVITLDAAPLAAARLAEQRGRDDAELARAILDAATAGVAAAADRHSQTLTAAVQQRHAEVVTELAGLAAQLPPGVGDDLALKTGDPLRERYLHARDLVAELGRLRALLGLVHPDQMFHTAPGSLEQAAMWCRSTWLYDNTHRVDAEPGSLGFVMQLIREAGADAIWCPTIAQAEARVAELIEEQRLDRVTQLPPRGATVW